MKIHLIIIYAVLIIGIGLSIYGHFNTLSQVKQLLQNDSAQTANFKKKDAVYAEIEVKTTTRTTRLKKSDAKDNSIDKEQSRLLDSLGFDPDKLPNF